MVEECGASSNELCPYNVYLRVQCKTRWHSYFFTFDIVNKFPGHLEVVLVFHAHQFLQLGRRMKVKPLVFMIIVGVCRSIF